MMQCGKSSISPLNVRNVVTGCLITFSNAGIVDFKPAIVVDGIGFNSAVVRGLN
jgi:hypothetical protein